MLQALKHRGPGFDRLCRSTARRTTGELIMRFKVAEQEETRKGFDIHKQLIRSGGQEVDRRIEALGAKIVEAEAATEYAYRYRLNYGGDLRRCRDYIEDVEGVEILSLGSAPGADQGSRRSRRKWPRSTS